MSSGKHLAKGSDKPELPEDGVLRVYTMRFCPYAQRVHLVLNAKKLQHHSVFINLTQKPEWLVEVSPLLKVPALELASEPGQPTLIESLIIAEYLDDRYEQNPLLPKEPLRRAADKILIERFNSVTSAVFKILLGGADSTDLWLCLDIFEEELLKRGTKYFAGDKPGFVDYMIWPWFERLGCAKEVLKESFAFTKQRYPQLSEWKARLEQDAAVQSFYATTEQHMEFLRTRKAGEANYDLLA